MRAPAERFVLARTVIADFRTRPAKDWGSEYHKWLRANGERNLSAVVVLPRREAIVRVVPMPGVLKKDIASAIGYQVDALHPYGDEQVAFGWAPLTAGNVLLGMMRDSTLAAIYASVSGCRHSAFRLHLFRFRAECRAAALWETACA